ncbi:MAG: hypothetical protein B7X90_14450 [Novosphingobium sp. 17-62-19]|uniref:DUF418 domain-containing protein n=1 Tax=Novosphingobium sp. 17-62-19 TaxID=1970406 RepID=UPI000BCC0940|nr:DUF418 domain-containing protein [Novosphingobium sp. 17-62-19]OZA17589.1 MAG: hypothetical protein B7X90_14450 [Novosphingobium sp. 17-62-19]HQS96577.1 DUF418 domain-containing protein [Novosphingobium sp.]
MAPDTSPQTFPSNRIEALDFLRGVAVLGILAINVTGFWGPSLATFSPAIPYPEPAADRWFALAFVLFEGKMRALFTLLFGASMVLFAQAAERQGAAPDMAQVRRLLWLLLFGYLHFALLWWGDILFSYALCGLGALMFRQLSPRQLLGIALPFYALSQGVEALLDLPGVVTEQAVLAGVAPAADMAEQAAMMDRIAALVAQDSKVLNAGFFEAMRLKLGQSALQPLTTTLSTFTETLPLMLTGMALLRLGMFADWPRKRLKQVATVGIGLGALPTLLALHWLLTHDWPPRAMFAAIEHGMALPHLFIAFGYAAALVLLFPLVRATWLGQRLTAAGRCAFTNYIGTTVLMGAIFSGWGLALGPELPRQWLPAFVALGWAAMLAWPRWWLARFGQGPLEAIWRRLALPRVNPVR